MKALFLDIDGVLTSARPHFVQTSEQDGMNSLEHFVRAKEALKRKVKWD